MRLCSVALGEDFSRTIKSPPGAKFAAVVGFMPSELARFAYAIGTSPATVTVLSELLLPLPQPPSPMLRAAIANAGAPNLVRTFFIFASN